MSSTLHYAEGSDVTLTSASLVLLSTARINTAPDALENGWAWPEPRFESAKKADNSACGDALYDNLTGLMWAKAASRHIYSWSGAKSHAQNSSLCGYNDWRSPTVNELRLLINYADKTSSIHWLNSEGFSLQDLSSFYFWSSTLFSLSGGYALYVDMHNGSVYYTDQTTNLYVLPVRGPN